MKYFNVMLPHIILPETVFPFLVKAKNALEARKKAFDTANENLSKQQIQFSLEGTTLIIEINPTTGEEFGVTEYMEHNTTLGNC